VNLSDPTRAIASTLDGAVLAVLASAGRPLTVGQVAHEAVRGSEIGIRRSLARLVEQGTVRATLIGRNQVHELNHDHVAAPIADLLAGLRTELWRRFRDELESWRLRPLYACVFGSAARGDGDEASDIDLLLVHPPFPGEKKPARLSPSVRAQLTEALGGVLRSSSEQEPVPLWESQIDRLRDLAERWSGNSLQVVDLSFAEWRSPPVQHRALLSDVRSDGLELMKARGLVPWPSPGSAHGRS
jgi:predicted nucleotidyltransferase